MHLVLALMFQLEETPAMQRGWLRRNFEAVKSETLSNGLIKSIVPDIFIYGHAPRTLSNMFNEHVLRKDLVGLYQPYGLGETHAESHRDLARLLRGIDFSASLKKFLPKEGQEAPVLGKTYEVIRQSHKLHDHGSSKLYDFVPVVGDLFGQEVRQLDFKEYHSHLRLF